MPILETDPPAPGRTSRPASLKLVLMLGALIPRRRPGRVLETLRAPVGTLRDKVAVGALSGYAAAAPARVLTSAREESTAGLFDSWGISPEMVDGFLRPFLSGVFLEADLSTSSRLFTLVWRSFARGTVTVPADGMAALPAQLATGLPDGTVSLGTRSARSAPTA